ncbi:MAG TPA: endolytic transglycosylase MltG [Anaerolineales bacterium]|nr:endolytic transglycosylase MltG [Anaerolineales bacterium]
MLSVLCPLANWCAIIASIVEREAIKKEEAPMIASVYLNRLEIGMKLEADPTVQYAIGYNALQNTWWTNPISALNAETPYYFFHARCDGSGYLNFSETFDEHLGNACR